MSLSITFWKTVTVIKLYGFFCLSLLIGLKTLSDENITQVVGTSSAN